MVTAHFYVLDYSWSNTKKIFLQPVVLNINHVDSMALEHQAVTRKHIGLNYFQNDLTIAETRVLANPTSVGYRCSGSSLLTCLRV